MALCSSCSAPLPVNDCRCVYCGTRNDMNFSGSGRFRVENEPSGRCCPDCAIPLQTVRIDTGAGEFAIERCDRCFGLFFDVGEVQAFLAASVSPDFSINLLEITTINEQRSTFGSRPVRYISCPDCGKMMNRVNYAAMSGVVVDQCREHGIWLDNGELVHLMEWQKAGGQKLADQKRETAEKARLHPVRQPLSASLGTDEDLNEMGRFCSDFLFRLFR